ncbi:3-hydroxyacyl-CoA dehydrogenase family protein [Yimella lutea]|uniref:3-hydroxyacyl-CoA dehydrogenase family protein n=1 Tax=Yimella lutea TaxID=587872 RepID=UPI001FE77952|nr:3-hydroxyacyl-CoA dehydrogenase family protein [Yimella lutea]
MTDKEINGFIANRILDAIRDEALFLLGGGYASITDIAAACRTALGHPRGPFELQDMSGVPFRIEDSSPQICQTLADWAERFAQGSA